MTHFALYILGPPRLERDGIPLAFPRRRMMALLVYLALNPQGHSRDELATLLWSDQGQSSARSALRRTLSELRRLLGAQTLDADPELGAVVQLVSHATEGLDFWVDATEFRRCLQEAVAETHSPGIATPEHLVTLAQVVQLYRGDLLSGFTLDDSPVFEEWQLLQTESLRSELRGALEQLAVGHLGRGELTLALRHARRWAELEPEDEAAHRTLMQIHAASGQRSAALTQYDACRRVLQQELGVDPADETQRLYECIRDDKIGEVVRFARPHYLPVPLTRLIGREVEVAELRQLLSEQRLVTLTGPGGVGKTRVAIRVGEEALVDFAAGVFFVDLAPVRDATLVIPTIATTFKLHEGGGRTLMDVLKEYLAQRHLLLILDNFEQVWQAGPQVSDLLAAAPELRALVTSRAILRLSGEHVYALSPLPVPQLRLPFSLPSIIKNEAVQLFLLRAQAVRPDLRLSQANAAAVAEICRQLDGLPLAIELAAARIRLLSPHSLLVQLGNRLRLLVGGARDLPARQQTLRASLEWSHGLLSPAEQVLFRRLAVFAGGCTQEAAEAVCAEAGLNAPDGIESLLDKQLLQSTEAEDGTRYGMLETVREFALECLEQSGESPAIHRQHADYYAAWQSRYFQDLYRLETELANLRAVMRWSIDSGQAELGLTIVNHIWFWTARNTEFRFWLDGLLGSPGAQAHSQARLMTFFIATLQAAISDDDSRCQALRDEYLALAYELGDQVHQLRSPYLTGYVLSGRRNHQGAADAFAEGLAGARKLGDRLSMAFCGIGLGISLLLLQEYDRAEASLQAALETFTEIAFVFGRIEALTALGYAALERKQPGQARTWLAQAIAEAEDIGFGSGLTDCLNGQAGIALQEGEPLRAARLYGTAEGLAIRFGSPTHEPVLRSFNERYLAALRLELDPAALQKAWQEGRRMSTPEALAYVLSGEAQPHQR